MPTTKTEPTRRRTTRKSVIIADRVARVVITFGGIGTIVAVCAVAVFLVVVAIPLFLPPTIEAGRAEAIAGITTPLYAALDQERRLGVTLDAEGTFRLIDVGGGKVISERHLPEGARLTAVSVAKEGKSVVFGFDDGTLRTGRVYFKDLFLDDSPEMADLAVGDSKVDEHGLIIRLGPDEIRRTEFDLKWSEPIQTDSHEPIRHLDHVSSRNGLLIVTARQTGDILAHRLLIKRDLITGEEATRLVTTPIKIPSEHPLKSPIQSLRLLGSSGQLLVIPETGPILRFDTAKSSGPALAAVEPTPDEGSPVTASTLLQGRGTLMLGRESGWLAGAFLVRGAPNETSKDKQSLVWAKSLRTTGESKAVSVAASTRSRLAAALFTNGTLAVYEMTTAEQIASVKTSLPMEPGVRLAFAPRDDGFLLASSAGVELVRFDAAHPEATLRALFEPVWYEGYSGPEHVWQSDTSGGAEPKFGMMPLIFGTLKATIYSMLFGVPLAILAAIYTSEFLHPSVKARIKPTIELMAGLPSVVLGFIGAMILAPWVAGHLCQTLAAFLTVPMTFLLAGHLWQLLPRDFTLRWEHFRFLLVLAVFPLGLWLAYLCGPVIERQFFAGSFVQWLDGEDGNGRNGWLFFLIPLAALAAIWIIGVFLDPWLQVRVETMTRFQAALVALGRFVAGIVLVALLAWVGASVLNGIGWDPRGTVVDTYVQRNSLIVGFIMGFAIIPIIYTIADDALSTVPEHLRSASLGAGATPWQTTTRIVVPTATSGLFSAIMIGLGRAVGETMIVLMAAGSTPIMEWNIFNGFRTLSANIAIELPEAAQGSTHYRTLFLAAVVLLAFTSVLNTIAELVRIRFRRRAYQL